MNLNNKISKISIAAAAAAFLLCSSAQAADVYYDVPLTSGTGVNATPNPSNNAYNPVENNLPAGALLGGDAQNNSGSTWIPQTITVWAVDTENLSSASGGTTLPAGWATGLELVGGSSTGVITGISNAYTVTPAAYQGSVNGTNYLSSFSSTPGNNVYDGVWALSFNVTHLGITNGEDFVFGVAGASDLSLNATACVTTACVSNGIIELTDPPASYSIANVWNYVSTAGSNPVISSDVNVLIQSPEPTTWMLFGVGIGVLGLVRRRRG